MKKKIRKPVSLLLCSAMAAGMLGGCGSSGKPVGETEKAAIEKSQDTTDAKDATESKGRDKITVDMFEEGGGWDELLASVKDSSELPDFEGEPLKLSFWMGHGTEVMDRLKAEKDVVSPEIERIFGITMDIDNSYDNQGSDLQSAILKHAATGDFADIGYGVVQPDLVNADKLYELSESGLLEKYAPNIYAAVQKTQPKGWATGWEGSGKQYGVPVDYNGTADNVAALYDDVDKGKYAYISASDDAMGPYHAVMVRDDILKLAYPEAKTQAEIRELFEKNGSFTREEVYDVPVHSKKDVNEFFYKIRDAINENNITEDGRPVYATYVADGSGENWALLQVQSLVWDGLPNANNLTYFQPSSNSIQFGYYQPRFKEDMKMFTEWVQDGVAPKACLVDQADQFTAKVNNGEYAVLYAWHWMGLALNEGKDYEYRKVYFDLPVDTQEWTQNRGEHAGNSIAIFKDQVPEKDLPRVLRFLDFLSTDVGMLLTCWGPYNEQNGLWEYTDDGGRRFKDEYSFLEDELVYNSGTTEYKKYNLADANSVYREGATPAWPGFYTLVNTGGIYSPAYMYDRDPERAGEINVNNFFSSGLFDKLPLTTDIIPVDCNIWTFTQDVPAMADFETVRVSSIDQLLMKCFTAENDSQFEEYFDAAIKACQELGIDEEALKACEDVIKTKYPEAWESFCKNIY